MKRRVIIILLLLLLSSSAALAALMYQQAGQVLYPRLPYDIWTRQRPALCSPKRKELVYADMRPGQTNPLKPLELSCEQAKQLPAESGYATTNSGMRIYYRLYGKNKKWPIMLHVSGITSTWLDAVRYVPMAQRIGFRLATMDLSNHGISDNNGMGAAYGCREAEDVLAVLKRLNQMAPKSAVFLTGTSMGTMAIANAAHKIDYSQVKAVMLENPVSSLPDIMHQRAANSWIPEPVWLGIIQIAGWRAGYDFHECSPLHQLKYLKVPTLVMTSARDKGVSVAMVESVYRALPLGLHHQLKVYPFGAHAAVWNGQPKEYETDLMQFWLTAEESQRPRHK